MEDTMKTFNLVLVLALATLVMGCGAARQKIDTVPISAPDKVTVSEPAPEPVTDTASDTTDEQLAENADCKDGQENCFSCEKALIERGSLASDLDWCRGVEPTCAKALIERGSLASDLSWCRGVEPTCAKALIERGSLASDLSWCRGVEPTCDKPTTKPLEMKYDPKPLGGCRKLIEPPTCSEPPQLSAADKEGYKECIAKAEKSPRAKKDMLESECLEFYMQKAVASWVQVCPSVKQYFECLDRTLDHTTNPPL
jgi:hypothetical protein